MTATFNSPQDHQAPLVGTLVDGADIFRRLERRRRRPLWVMLLPLAVFAAFALSGLLILEGMIRSDAAPAQAAPIASPAVAAPVAPQAN
jgi:hypothetical protein